uniref:Uncharacterized protein n=1 Tax=Spermophilus dauricus TaxID=99837 RepID=A0A8C9P0Z9_SPEDA
AELDMTGLSCSLLLTLMSVVLTRTRAVPVPSAISAHPDARDCDMAQFKTLAPRELQAFRKARDAFVSVPVPPACALASSLGLPVTGLCPVHPGLPPALAALGNLRSLLEGACPSLREPALFLLTSSAPPAQPTAGPSPQGPHRHRLSHWLQRLRQAPEKESPACLQASVTFNLLRLLVRDLKCVASGHCASAPHPAEPSRDPRSHLCSDDTP